MEKVAWKCITCGGFTYSPGCDAGTPGLQIRETTQCLSCTRGGPSVSPSLVQEIRAKYARGEY